MEMPIIPTKWTYVRENILPVLKVMGEGTNLKAKNILLFLATELIQKAEKYNAQVSIRKPQDISKYPVAVYFWLIFKTETQLYKFIEELKLGKW